MSDTLRDKIISSVLQVLLYMWAVWMTLTMLIVLMSADIVMIVLYSLFGAAIAANLALGLTLRHATRSAQVYVANAMRSAARIGRGHGPLNHFWGK